VNHAGSGVRLTVRSRIASCPTQPGRDVERVWSAA